jgi:MOSC domain-containing protein YiiM
MNNPKIKNLAIGKPKDYQWKDGVEQSAIGKISVENAELRRSGFIDDDVANQILFHNQNNKRDIEKILLVNELAEVWKEKLKKLL